MTAYNKQNLNGVDLKKSENVENIFNAVLALKPSLKTVSDVGPNLTTDAQPSPEIEPTTKVEPKPILKLRVGPVCSTSLQPV